MRQHPFLEVMPLAKPRFGECDGAAGVAADAVTVNTRSVMHLPSHATERAYRFAGCVTDPRHPLAALAILPGRPRVVDEHYPHHAGGNHPRPPRPRPRTKAEVVFLEIGDGAHAWLVEAAATGATRVRAKMARAVEFAAILGAAQVDQALGLAAAAGRFDEPDLGSILDHLTLHGDPGDLVRADEGHSAQPGTGSWGRFGR
jgi:hypothetical protein